MPPTQTIHFDLDGGPLSGIPSAGNGAAGSYTLFLFESDGLTIVPPSPFNERFGEPEDNTHALPGTPARNDGRVLVLGASVGLMDSERKFAVHLTIMQDGETLGTASEIGVAPGTDPTHKVRFSVVLSGTPSVAAADKSSRLARGTRTSARTATLPPVPDKARTRPKKTGEKSRTSKRSTAKAADGDRKGRRGPKRGGNR